MAHDTSIGSPTPPTPDDETSGCLTLPLDPSLGLGSEMRLILTSPEAFRRLLPLSQQRSEPEPKDSDSPPVF